jgi:hypothetical protein
MRRCRDRYWLHGVYNNSILQYFYTKKLLKFDNINRLRNKNIITWLKSTTTFAYKIHRQSINILVPIKVYTENMKQNFYRSLLETKFPKNFQRPLLDYPCQHTRTHEPGVGPSRHSHVSSRCVCMNQV